MKKTLAILLFISLSLSSFAFNAVLHISVTPNDTKVYVDNVFKGTGNVTITLDVAREVQIRYEKEGYITQTYKYVYDLHKGSPLNYGRGDNYFVVELEKSDKPVKQESTKETNNKIASPSLKEKSLGQTQMIDGVYVFVNSIPNQPYETAFQFKTIVVTAFSCPSIDDIVKDAVKSARKNGLPFDAVIIGSGKIDLAIKFK